MSADGSRAGPMERDIELAITALKKGACLLKYGRRGKPKFCPFRLANDESVLVWLSGNEEKHLKLSHVSRIIPGQRTTIFQRHPRPDKEYQSFSLIYGDRSLDLICKDKDEAEVWFTGLKALISQCHNRKGRTESRIDGFSSEANSPHTYTQKSSPLSSAFGNGDSLQKESVEAIIHTPFESSPQSNFQKVVPDVLFYAMPQKVFQPSESICGSVHSLSSGGSDGINSCTKGIGVDAIRVSLSSAVSSSSHGSGHADGDALGDVFIWGEGTGDGILGGGIHQMGSAFGFKMDSLFPKALESAVVLDVQNIACGGQHAALVTKQGEVFTWGEESGGRLGHGVDSDVSHPKLIDALTNTNIELVACGEHHTCAVTLSGDLYTWGNTYNFGLLGHGNEVSHWVPKRLNGPLEGIHVSSISCGPWHTAVVTSAGQLFTFGDGTFGVLGHGDRESVPIPREVESLRGLRTVRAACGVWHTAAVVEVMVGSSNSSHCSSGKLFTWGDGDKGRLGHGDKEPRLVPTCVAIVEPNFCQVVCGHSLTVALTTSGQVYTMGSPVYGQLGHPQTDGKIPVRVEKLTKCFVEEIACGAYHVAVLTSRTEVYTWGKGANGRLGHGDEDDRSFPAVVEALKDKQVKSIACGTNFTAAICLHKWVSGDDQSMCSGCHLPFNFKRKRHNCYNCGLVFCHSCSSKKSLRASLAPNPNKLYRVCDNCFSKLKKTTEVNSSYHSTLNRGGSINQGLSEVVGKGDKMNSRTQMHPGKYTLIEGFKDSQSGLSWRNRKLEFNSCRVSPLPTAVSQGASLTSTRSSNLASGSSKKFFSVSLPGSRIVSRATSPTSKRSSPPRSMTPTPTLGGLAAQKSSADNSRTNDTLSQEVHRLKAEVEALMCKTQLQKVEMERTSAQLREAIAVAGEESAKCKTAKEVIKLLTSQLKEVAERLPVGAARYCNSPSLSPCGPNLPADVSVAALEKLDSLTTCHIEDSNGSNSMVLSKNLSTSDNNNSIQTGVGHLEAVGRNKNKTTEDETNHMAEWVEQDEPGVYITLGSLPGGVRDLKRVRFSRKRFSEKQAEQWWAANKAKVYQRYNVPMGDKSTVGIGREGLAC